MSDGDRSARFIATVAVTDTRDQSGTSSQGFAETPDEALHAALAAFAVYRAECAELPPLEIDVVVLQRAKLLEAVRYLLTRAQTDTELAYVLGPCTEAWERLVAAEAVALGHHVEVRRVDRMRDLRAPHCRRDPRVVELEARVEELEEELREARSL